MVLNGGANGLMALESSILRTILRYLSHQFTYMLNDSKRE